MPCILSKTDAGGRPPGEEVLRVQRCLRSARPPALWGAMYVPAERRVLGKARGSVRAL